MNIYRTPLREIGMTVPVDHSAGNVISQADEPECELATDSYMVLQPILTPGGELLGYESLSRSGWDNWNIGGARTAIQALIEDWTFLELHELARTHQVFANYKRRVLTDCVQEPLPFSVVLELLETVQPDQEVFDACRRFKALGYQIAQDDFQPSEPMEEFTNLADNINVDFHLSDSEERKKLRQHLNVKPVLLIAERVETPEELQIALYEGFSLIQGYYLGSPDLLSKYLAAAESKYSSAA